MGQAWSPDLPPAGGILLSRAQLRSSNGALTAARFHSRSSGRKLADDYKVECGAILGRGAHSLVVRAQGRINHRKCAVKMFYTQVMSPEVQSLMAAEVEIHLTLDHPNVVRLYDVYESEKESFGGSVCMVMECCLGGELYYHLSEKGSFSEAETAEAAWQMLSAVAYLHSHDVVHRDLKLENFLYSRSDRNTLKLIDFGFAKVWDPRTTMQAACGTADYVGPEVLIGEGYTSKCDMWSLGVIMFMLISGRAPIHAERREELQRRVQKGEVDWSLFDAVGGISVEARDFLRSLLTFDEGDRMDAATALLHPWLIKAKAAQEGNMAISPGIFTSLQQYACAPPLRRAVLQLVAQQLSQEEVHELTQLFLALCSPALGTICLERLQGAVDSAMRLLAVLDVNQDGQVYYTEFLAATMGALERPRNEALREAFSRLDARSQGRVAAEDFWAAFGDGFEGVDAEALLAGAAHFGKPRGEALDFEAFERIVEGAVPEGTLEDTAVHVPASFPAPRSPSPPQQRHWSSEARKPRSGRLRSLEGPLVAPWQPVAPWEPVH